MKTADVVIVGSGFAGAATAFHLSRTSDLSIVVLESEKTPGVHASGRNASLLLQSVADPDIRRLAVASRKAYEEHREAVGFRQVGSLLLGTADRLDRVREPDLVASRFLGPGEIATRVPAIFGHPFERALETASDGVMDTWALLNFYLDGARQSGAEVVYDAEVGEIAGDRVRTRSLEIAAGVVVDAAGAWAASVARHVGRPGPALRARKRHLFVLDGVGPVDPDWPFVWSLERCFYFRPESGGLLFSLCDEEESESFEETVSPGIEEQLAEFVFAQQLPRFEGAEIRKVWSCFRTATGDGRFLIGPDPERKGFFWVAGLWGHGMGCSWEVGRLAAEALLGAPPPPAFDPARFSS